MRISRSDFSCIQAELASLARRVAELEALTGSGHNKKTANTFLVALYVDAQTETVDYTVSAARLWRAVIMGLDEAMIFDLIKTTHDPFPWRHFIKVLSSFTKRGFDMKEPLTHLWGMAAALMNLQGLEMLTPEDVYRMPSLSYQ